MFEWISIILLGIIEGITEFLPISSTGHLLLAENLLVKNLGWLHQSQSDLFNVVIQCGAVIAVLPLFPERCRQMFTFWKNEEGRKFGFNILLSFLITAVGGWYMEKHHYKLTEAWEPVAWAVLIGGILFVLVEQFCVDPGKNRPITWKIAVVVGIGQLAAAMFPGLSRSGATILLMLPLGIKRTAATEFSFLVGVPTMMAAGGYKIFKALHASHGQLGEPWAPLLVCSLVSAVVSFIAVKWLLGFVQTHTFKGFGWYRIVLGTVVFGGLFLGWLK